MDNEMRRHMLESLMGGALGGMFGKKEQDDDEFEPLGPLSKEDKKEWDDIIKEHLALKNQVELLNAKQEVINARRKMFWCKLEEKTGIYDRNMRIKDNGILLIEKKTPDEEASGLPEIEAPDRSEDPMTD